MIGNFDLPIAKGNARTYIFTPTPGSNQLSSIYRSLQRWDKPKGINFVYGLLIGAGSGGGGGFSIGAGTAGGGGGGGTPGATIQFLQLAYLMPDTLYVSVAAGGLGGAADANGGFPNITGLFYGSMGSQAATTRVYYIYPNNQQATTQSGRSGSASTGGAGGTTLTVASTTAMPGIVGFSNFVQATSPNGGQNGGFGAGGNNAPFLGRPQGGAGGGGVSSSLSYAGGNVLGPTTSVNSVWSRNLLGGASAGVNGENGITLFEPTFFSLPGAGGAGNVSGTGGAGGKGGIGCGGGGGGAGITGGRGGDGGDGFIMLVCW